MPEDEDSYVQNTALRLPLNGKPETSSKPLVPLFRLQAIEARAPSHLPRVIQIRVPYMTATAIFAVAVLFLLAGLCVFGRLTQIVIAEGILVPDKSSVKTYPPKAGIIVKQFVIQGQKVRKGDPLYAISGDQYDDRNAAILNHQSELIRLRVANIQQQKELETRQEEEQVKLFEQQKQDSQQQLEIFEKSAEAFADSVELDRNILSRRQKLQAQNAVSVEQTEQAGKLLSNDQERLLSLTEKRQTLLRQIAQYESQARLAPIELSMKLSSLEEQATAQLLDLSRTEMERETIVQAPIDGEIATEVAYVGQRVTPDQPLVVVNPSDSKLIAELFVTSAGIGFLKPGGRAALKYDAYPYQTFGYFMGHIRSISNVALMPQEVQTLQFKLATNQPVFKVVVDLDQQDVTTYGYKTVLLPGSTFSADLSGETRNIWQWILNPLLSVKGYAFSSSGNPK
ncbi:HlyD family efflux transporter periplasmic adaptor subunit (plasmid) [Rhizobium lusitanum]|uniref:HlyD family secretion protein n=1 Tax=Rhizobium lusitanum TaxID=293958 RepID=UPI001615E602|nr:HlyD family efflux transporter periplasmic adaptor subunit [Rhizobium lusitanum]QND44439.1 HlyD family efflux transporter periplasmic adaptor subunit [Rhizobium lusitanum]